MIKNSLYKDGDTFYYILPRFYLDSSGIEHKQFYVMRYQYWDQWNHCFNQDWMFKTEKQAKEKADQLNKNDGY